MALYHEDIANIDLESGNIYRSFMNHSIGYGDDDANRFGIRAYRNGVAEDLGGTCAGYFIRADGGTVVIADGVVSGNLAYVTLPEACYAVEGNFTLAIKVSGSGVTGTMRIVDGVVSRTSTSAVVDPGTIIPSVENLLDAIDAAVASIPSDYTGLWTSLAPNFSTSTTYHSGEYCTYNGKLYRFTSAHVAGSWNSSHVTQVTIGEDLSTLKNMVHPIFLITKANRTRQFEIKGESVSGGIKYTITTVSTQTIHGLSDLELGPNYAQYKFEYGSGSGNVGTSATNYKFDNTIVSGTISGFAAFVADRADYTLKIIDLRNLTDQQRVIAMFYGTNPALQNGFATFGDNATLFNVGKRGFNKFYFATLNSARGALTWSKDSSNIYTVTRNKDTFGAFGITERDQAQIAIGAGRNDLNYPIPSSFSSSSGIEGFAMIAANWADETTNTWVIISLNDFNNNADKYIALGMVYGTENYIFFSELAEQLFTNVVYGGTNKTEYTAQMALWNSAICNSISPINGKVIYDPVNYTITFDHVILAPNNTYPGSFDNTKQSGIYTIDWSNETNPTYMRAIYIDKRTHEFVAYSQENLNTEALRNEKRLQKDGLLLICIVFNGKYVYTCGAAQPGTWFVNSRDIYASNNIEGKDLFKAFQRVGVIGDSLSVGYLYNKNTGTATTRALKYAWPKVAMRDAGGNYWLNFGTSGQSVLTWCSNATYGKVQLETANNKCQAYIIGLGENDQSDSDRNVPLGQPSDIVDDYTQVATTYYGGYARIIQIIKHLNPTAKIFCLTNPRTGGNRAEYNVAIRYICDTYYSSDDDVILVDLASNYGEKFNSGYLPSDSTAITGGHYSPAGYARIASIMETAISEAMQTKVASMWDIATIPYDTGTPSANTMTE